MRKGVGEEVEVRHDSASVSFPHNLDGCKKQWALFSHLHNGGTYCTSVFFPSSCHLWLLGEGVSVGEGGGGECGEPYPSVCQSCSDDGLVVVQPARRVFEAQ